ncbi:hypothetical protein LEMLEM_LOCUS4097 [Lemmus lemmus]
MYSAHLLAHALSCMLSWSPESQLWSLRKTTASSRRQAVTRKWLPWAGCIPLSKLSSSG